MRAFLVARSRSQGPAGDGGRGPREQTGRSSAEAGAGNSFLRMNRDFIQYMRDKHAALIKKLTKQYFNCSVVEPEADQVRP